MIKQFSSSRGSSRAAPPKALAGDELAEALAAGSGSGIAQVRAQALQLFANMSEQAVDMLIDQIAHNKRCGAPRPALFAPPHRGG